jgi:hypothetical protein
MSSDHSGSLRTLLLVSVVLIVGILVALVLFIVIAKFGAEKSIVEESNSHGLLRASHYGLVDRDDFGNTTMP